MRDSRQVLTAHAGAADISSNDVVTSVALVAVTVTSGIGTEMLALDKESSQLSCTSSHYDRFIRVVRPSLELTPPFSAEKFSEGAFGSRSPALALTQKSSVNPTPRHS